MTTVRLIIALCLLGSLLGCGQKGPLVVPQPEQSEQADTAAEH